MRTQILACFILLIPVINRTYSQTPNWLDTGFGTGGTVTTNITSNDAGYRSALQSDGKILVVGFSNSNILVARYNTDGTLDNSFNSSGIKTIDINSNDCAAGIGQQSDGKIIVSGYTSQLSDNDFVVLRLLENGDIDTSFGIAGITTTDLGFYDEYATCMKIQSDDKIVVGGYINTITDNNFVVVRYNMNGDIDSTFNYDGITTDSIGPYKDYAYGIDIQADGKIVMTGCTGYNFSDLDICIARYTPDGILDTSFSDDGRIITSLGTDQDGGWDVGIQPDGKIVIVGFSDTPTDELFAILRYKSNGDLDSSFSSDGILTYGIPGIASEFFGVDFQTDGKIVAVGTYGDYDTSYFAVMRFKMDGTVDTSFNTTGLILTQMNRSNATAKDVFIQPDGKIVASGFTNHFSTSDIAIARYMPIVYLGVEDPGDDNYLQVYPNPTTGILNIVCGENIINGTIQIKNMLGQTLQTSININLQPGQNHLVDLSPYSNGCYVLELNGYKTTVIKN